MASAAKRSNRNAISKNTLNRRTKVANTVKEASVAQGLRDEFGLADIQAYQQLDHAHDADGIEGGIPGSRPII